ncbi:MAG: hypothetical protein ACXACP_03255 [Candidatus Hodarchaeales archaeon]
MSNFRYVILKEGIVSVLIIVIFVSANLNYNYPFQETINESTASKRETKNTLPQIHWIVDDFVSAQALPIVFQYAEGLNTTILTSWGYINNLTLESPDRAASMYIWIPLPSSNEGTGNINIVLDDTIESNHSVTWRRFIQPSTSPMSLSFTYRRFSYWNGESTFNAHIYPNGSAFIDYKITSGNGPMEIEWFPYDHNFTYNLLFNSSVWPTFIEYLITNEAINWQSWEYLPNAPYGDLGGWKKSLLINWNGSYQSAFHAMVDDDSGVNSRLLTSQEVEDFFGLLMTNLAPLIDAEMNKTDTTTVGLTYGSIFIHSLIFFLILNTYRKKRIKFKE